MLIFVVVDFVCVSVSVFVHVSACTYIYMPIFVYICNTHLGMDNVIIYSVLLCINKLSMFGFVSVSFSNLRQANSQLSRPQLPQPLLLPPLLLALKNRRLLLILMPRKTSLLSLKTPHHLLQIRYSFSY